MCELRLSGLVKESIVDGPGLRYTVFVQGCPHNCIGCHNPETHDPLGGYLLSINEIFKDIKNNPLLDGVTFSGGEPFEQVASLAALARMVKKEGLNVIVYTGYIWEKLIKNSDFMPLVKEADFIVDGPFILAQRTLELPFRGSSNQRIINVKDELEKLNCL